MNARFKMTRVNSPQRRPAVKKQAARRSLRLPVLIILAAIPAVSAEPPARTNVFATDHELVVAPPNLGSSRSRLLAAQTPQQIGSTNAPLPALPAIGALAGYVPDDRYKLRVGDRISFQIVEDRDLPRSLVVADSGELDVPYLGRVPASDKTCKQLADELKAQLEKEYYYRATVVLALDVANKFLGRIYVWGQVKNQGAFELTANENLTAGKAILRAGGFGDFANKKKVKLVRARPADASANQILELNMVEILEDGKMQKDVLLQPDDLVIVPSRLINF
jgi:protein involved in polysaccharide export with SLBB domain